MVKAFMLALKMDFKDTVYNFRKTATGSEFTEIPLPEKEGSIRLLKEFVDLDIKDKIKDISTPTLLIHGKKDKIINYNGSVYAHKNIKNSELILVDSHHAPFLEEADIIE